MISVTAERRDGAAVRVAPFFISLGQVVGSVDLL